MAAKLAEGGLHALWYDSLIHQCYFLDGVESNITPFPSLFSFEQGRSSLIWDGGIKVFFSPGHML